MLEKYLLPTFKREMYHISMCVKTFLPAWRKQTTGTFVHIRRVAITKTSVHSWAPYTLAWTHSSIIVLHDHKFSPSSSCSFVILLCWPTDAVWWYSIGKDVCVHDNEWSCASRSGNVYRGRWGAGMSPGNSFSVLVGIEVRTGRGDVFFIWIFEYTVGGLNQSVLGYRTTEKLLPDL